MRALRCHAVLRRLCSTLSRSTNTMAITVACMMATFLAALDTTVVGAAMPTIVGALGGLALYSWVFSAYLLTSTTTVPVYGRLADMYGRKPVFMVGASLFILGSALCGAATSMEQLILFRTLQGLGAGGVLPISITMVGDLYPIRQRAQIQGLFSAIWGISALMGPAVGGLIVDRIEWRWAFYLNLPFGLLAMLLFGLYLHETIERRRRTIDYGGAIALTVAVTLLLLALLENGQPGSGMLLPPWVLLATSLLLFGLFLQHESRTPEPILPLDLFGRRVLSVSYAANFLMGATLFGFSSFVPTFVQGVLSGTALNAGAVLAPMSLGWPVGSTAGGRLILRYGYRPIVLAGAAFILAGSLMMLAVDRTTGQPFLMMVMVVVGLGMGLCGTSFLVAIQSSVGWEQRGIATASIQFFQSIGGAVGVAIMGAMMNSSLSQGLRGLTDDQATGPDGASQLSSASVILDPVARSSLPGGLLEGMQSALASSLHTVFVAVAIMSALGFILAFLFPGGSVEEHAGGGRSGGAGS